MMKRNFPRVAVVVFVAVLTGCGPKPVPVTLAAAPPVVLVATATGAEASTFVEAVATLEGTDSREIQSPVAGYLVKQAYQDGAFVRAGDLLFEIDTNPAHAITKVTSPIAGVAAHAACGIGDRVNSSTTLTTVSVVDVMTANFALPAPVYRDHAAWFTQLLGQPMATRPENVRLLDDGTTVAKTGKLSTVEIHPASPTRIYMSSALFANPDHVLKPGQFARVRLTIDADANAILVPQRSVTRLPDADQVMVVKPDNTVEVRRVTLGNQSGSFWIVINGLAPGERVVAVGLEHCAPGGTVTPQPYIEPAPPQ